MLHQWDHAFHQSGYVGSSVVFHNGDAKHALETLPMEARRCTVQRTNTAFAGSLLDVQATHTKQLDTLREEMRILVWFKLEILMFAAKVRPSARKHD